ncbi:hypothetical protein MLGJGCBP_04052 [Rhodococcus sp. T7]|nr:hypothetical protein MLGJGCBP_04052 [Rhodococcus sp. T7]
MRGHPFGDERDHRGLVQPLGAGLCDDERLRDLLTLVVEDTDDGGVGDLRVREQ